MNVNKNLYNAALDTLSYLGTVSIGNSNDLVHDKPSQIVDRLGKIFENVTEDQASNLLRNDNFIASLKKLSTEITSIPQEAVETGETKEKLEGLISRINSALNSVKKVDQIPGTIVDIPVDLLAQIGKFLDEEDLLNFSQASKKLLEARPKIIGQNENFINFFLRKSLKTKDRYPIPEKLLDDSTKYGRAIKSISLQGFALGPKDLPEIIDRFPNLESLNFADQDNATDLFYEMTDPFIDLSRLEKLKNLRLQGSADLLAKAFPHVSKKLESLELFIYDLDDTKGREILKNKLLSFLTHASSLKEVHFNVSSIDDEILQALAKSSPKLETFSASSSECTKSGFQQFFGAANSLKFIDLNYEDIDDKGLQELIDSNPQLEVLKLGECQQITKEGFLQALATAKSLKSVNLGRTEIDDKGLQELIKSNRQLEILQLGRTQITKEGFLQALATAKSLKFVTLGNTGIGDEGLQALIDSNPQLEVLDLAECQQITKEGFRQAFASAKSLKCVSLTNTEIGDEGVQALTESNPRLEILYLWRCRQITEQGVLQSLVQARSLKRIITKHFYGALQGKRPQDGALQGKRLQDFLVRAKS